jgi:hypothetical protein
MALIIAEGFDNIGTSGNAPTVNGKFTVTGSNWRIGSGAWGGSSLGVITSAGGQDLRWPLSNTATFIVGCWFMKPHIAADAGIFAGYDGSTRGFGIAPTASGGLRAMRGITQMAISADGIIRDNVWHHIELKATIHNTTGAYSIKLDGVVVLSATNVNTRAGSNNYVTELRLLPGGGNSQSLYYFDDLYFMDSSGSVNNDTIGPCRIQCLVPTADSGTQQFTTSTGSSHYALVDENPSNSDTDYIEDTVSGHSDLFDVTDPDFTTIKGLQINAVVRETDASPFDINLTCKSGSTTSAGSNIAIGGTTFSTKTRILESDPDTSSAWSNSGLASAKFGVAVP